MMSSRPEQSPMNLTVKIPTRLAAPEQPPAPPRTRVHVAVRDVATAVYNEVADYLAELAVEQKKPAFARRQRFKFNLREAVAELERRVAEEFDRDLVTLGGSATDAAGYLAAFQQEARRIFLTELARNFPELRPEIYKLAPELAPPPPPSKETMAKVQELWRQAELLAVQIDAAASTIEECRAGLDELWRREAELLRGTSEWGHSRIKAMMDYAPRVTRIKPVG